jgi:hypothetical protein
MALKDTKKVFVSSTIKFQLAQLEEHLTWARGVAEKFRALAQVEPANDAVAEDASPYATGTLRDLHNASGVAGIAEQLADIEAQIEWAVETQDRLTMQLDLGRSDFPGRKEWIEYTVARLTKAGDEKGAEEFLAREEARKAAIAARRAEEKAAEERREAKKAAEAEQAKKEAEAARNKARSGAKNGKAGKAVVRKTAGQKG